MPTLSKVPDTMTDTTAVSKSKKVGEEKSDDDSDIDIEGMFDSRVYSVTLVYSSSSISSSMVQHVMIIIDIIYIIIIILLLILIIVW